MLSHIFSPDSFLNGMRVNALLQVLLLGGLGLWPMPALKAPGFPTHIQGRDCFPTRGPCTWPAAPLPHHARTQWAGRQWVSACCQAWGPSVRAEGKLWPSLSPRDGLTATPCRRPLGLMSQLSWGSLLTECIELVYLSER